MMDHLLPGVDALVELEHKTIVDMYGDGYHSTHEGYAVLLEHKIKELEACIVRMALLAMKEDDHE